MQPENIRELFHYALAVLMVEDGEAEITRTEHIDGLVSHVQDPRGRHV